MKIALLISGRAVRYDACLLPALNNSTNHSIDVFMSLNDEHSDCLYYQVLKERMGSYLKGCVIQKYIIHDEIVQLFNPTDSISHTKTQINLTKVNGKFLPYHPLSMYYNDTNAFHMACEYADKNNFEYDIYMKFRADIIIDKIPDNLPFINHDIHLHSAYPLCDFISRGLFNKPIICDSFAYGNRKTMNIFCNTYSYVLQKNKLYNGLYYINYEDSLTDNIYENNVPHTIFKFPYELDANRRMFDDNSETTIDEFFGQDSSIRMKITDPRSINYIPPIKQ